MYVEFVKGNIDLPTMKNFAEVINRFLSGDYESIADGEKEFKTYGDVSESILRLAFLGLKLRAILFPEMGANSGIIELDSSKTINMV